MLTKGDGRGGGKDKKGAGRMGSGGRGGREETNINKTAIVRLLGYFFKPVMSFHDGCLL